MAKAASSASAATPVLAMGSFSPLLPSRWASDLPIYPAKGYSVTYKVTKTRRWRTRSR
jgi:glycine/D-amino acid oxidase-like deaminating enzyme